MFLKKGEVFAYVGCNQNLKDLKCSPGLEETKGPKGSGRPGDLLSATDTMSLRTADLGSVCARATPWVNSSIPTEPPLISSTRASALESSTRSESINAFSAVLSAEGRVVGLCWEHLRPKGPKGLVGSERGAWTFGALDYMLTDRRGTHLQVTVVGIF